VIHSNLLKVHKLFLYLVVNMIKKFLGLIVMIGSILIIILLILMMVYGFLDPEFVEWMNFATIIGYIVFCVFFAILASLGWKTYKRS